VLVGGGHAHVHVLKSFGMRPEPGVKVTLVTRDVETPYSGMLPGLIAGHYEHDACHIDLWRFASAAGARLIHAEAIGLDPERRILELRDRPALPYDVLSLDIGSTPRMQAPGADRHAVPVKPIDRFLQSWQQLVAQVERTAEVPRIVVAGGGAGGVEAALAIHARLRAALGQGARAIPLSLVTRGALLERFNTRARSILTAELLKRRIAVFDNAEVERVEAGILWCRDGRSIAFDEVFWVTGAGAAQWLGETSLALDSDGFIAVAPSLRSCNQERVFAAGDVASALAHPREKAGVYAVRQGPPLADNLRRVLRGEPLQPFVPQKRALALIGTGDREAVAVWGPLALKGRWLWTLKESIDRRWMRRYQHLSPMPDRPEGEAAETMRCGGCGAKVSSAVLARVLQRLRSEGADLIDLDDAAILPSPAGETLLQTVDHFRAFVDDPFRFGRIAANHALGDIYAMGGQPATALAIAGVPPGAPDIVEDQLYQMLAGALAVFARSGVRLVGGHSAEAAEISLGFAITGSVRESHILCKRGLAPGDRLILTKPIGTGVILAGLGQGQAKASWIEEALATMEVSSARAAHCLLDHGAHACTDVTGFGLLGHLLEMLNASKMSAVLEVASIPELPGARELITSGTVSTLHAENARCRDALVTKAGHPGTELLFDPQTAGGLLAGIPAARAQSCIAALRQSGYAHASVIGSVKDAVTGRVEVELL
jgi:selenide,water dikinase